MTNIPSLELQTFTDEPLASFKVNVWQQSWLDKILHKPTARTFTIYRTRVCNMGRAAALANEMELSGNIDSLESLVQVTLPLIHTNRIKVLRLIACCIQNNDKEPASSLIRFLDANLNADMLNEILTVCLWNLGLQSFLSAIISIKGTSANFASDTDVEPVTTPEAKPDPLDKDGGVNTVWTSPGSMMKYFRWSHSQIMNMSWDNYMMYLVSIPKASSDDKGKDDEPGEEVDLINLYG